MQRTAVADEEQPRLPGQKSLLRSRAPLQPRHRKRAKCGGRPSKVHCAREALYEWFTGIRYAIDWKQLIAENRSRGQKHLARFPRVVIQLRAQQLLQDYTYACLLNGEPVHSFTADFWWCKRWEEDYGLSMRQANRKYSVPRSVVKERMEIFWLCCFVCDSSSNRCSDTSP